MIVGGVIQGVCGPLEETTQVDLVQAQEWSPLSCLDLFFLSCIAAEVPHHASIARDTLLFTLYCALIKVAQQRRREFVPPQCSQEEKTLLGFYDDLGHGHSPAQLF